MAKPNIMLTRIDNRLIHGQIIGQWAGTIGANLILVADDEVATNDLEKNLMQMAAQTMGFETRFFTVDKTIEIIHKAAPHQKIFLICRTPDVVLKLINGGVPISSVNVGNMHYDPSKTNIGVKVYASKEEMKELEQIKAKVDEIFVQDTPGAEKKYL